MLPSPRLASLSALPSGNGDAMSKVSSKADDAAPAKAVLSCCVDACRVAANGRFNSGATRSEAGVIYGVAQPSSTCIVAARICDGTPTPVVLP